ncbi:MAG: TIGR00730 family Rossman fold protein [Bacteroidota bacterium]
MKTVAVFCGSKMGIHPIYAEAAKQVGERIAQRAWRVVYGGGDMGLMGIVASTALENGGYVTGVITDFLQAREGRYPLQESFVVESMHQRKMMMAERADAFLILPGGFGTMDEFMEIITWQQLGLHQKTVGVFNVLNYYKYLLQQLDHMVKEGFLLQEHRDLIRVSDQLSELLDSF